MRPIKTLQVLRASAALVVVAFHIQGELERRGFADPFPDLTLGAFGVDLFFVISGFIMVYSSAPLFGALGAPALFLGRRLARIVPLYWLFTTFSAVVAVALARLPGHPPASAAHILASYLFMPAARPEDGAILPTCPLGWTLNYEMFFYACFALAIRFRRGVAVAAVAAGLGLLVLLGAVTALPWPLAYWSNTLCLEFVFGMGLALLHAHGWRMPARLGIPLGAAALVAAYGFVPFIDSLSAWRGLAWGVPAAAVTAAALGLPFHGRSLPGRLAVRLGDASYSLYLAHSALFIAAFSLLSRVVDPHALPPLLYAALLLAGSILTALVLFRLFERPVARALQGRPRPLAVARPPAEGLAAR